MASKKPQEDQRAGAVIIHGAEECYNHSLTLLNDLGFPKGMLALKELQEFGLVKDTGFAWMKQKAPHEHLFAEANTLARYDVEVTAYVEKGKMTKMTGVKGKQLFLWVPVVEMSLEESGGVKRVYFKSPVGVRKSFPIAAFMDDEEKKHLEKVAK